MGSCKSSPLYSWGSDKDARGVTIGERGTGSSDLVLPRAATDADVAMLVRQCPRLYSLDISRCDLITDAALQQLVGQEELCSLNLEGTAVTDVGLQTLSHAPRLQRGLQTLNLSFCEKITDDGLQHIADLQYLETLKLRGCKQITDAGLAHIAGLQQLHTLDLGGCKQITDAGLAEHLAGLANLVDIDAEADLDCFLAAQARAKAEARAEAHAAEPTDS